MSFSKAAAAILFAASTAAQASTTLTTYAIGNSLTADNYHVAGPQNLAAQAGINFVGAVQINGGVGLADQWYNYVNGIAPAIASPSSFDQALASSRWDAIVVEPYKNTATEEITAAKQILGLGLANPQNASADLYVFAPPPQLAADGRTDFTRHWLAPYAGEAVGGATTRAFFRAVYDPVKAAYPNNRVSLIPTGDVWAAVAAKIDAGQFPGVTDSTLLYRDTLHGSYYGQLVSASTWFAMTTHRDPRGLALPSGFGDITQAQADVIFNAVWDVIGRESAVTHILTPGDSNADGRVDFADLLKLSQAYGATGGHDWYSSDFDENGAVNFNDLFMLVQHYGAGLPTSVPGASSKFTADLALAQSLVPEPVAATAIASVIGLAVRRRRN